VSRYQKGKTNLDFTEARNSEWQWHQLGHMLVCTSLQTDNHASTALLSFLQAGCPSCRPTNSPEGKRISNIHWMPISPVACIISATSPDNPGAYAFSSSSVLLKIKYGKWKRENTKEARMEHKKSRQNAKRVISSAKEKKQKECANDLNDSECQSEIFLMAKQMAKERQDITGLNCIKGASGKVIVDGKGIKDS